MFMVRELATVSGASGALGVPDGSDVSGAADDSGASESPSSVISAAIAPIGTIDRHIQIARRILSSLLMKNNTLL